MISVSFDPSLDVYPAAFQRLANDMNDFREVFRRIIQQVAQPSMRTNFDVGGRPQWELLSQFTIDRKRREGMRGNAERPLLRTTRLRAVSQLMGIWEIAADEAAINRLPGDAYYGAIHMTGWMSADGFEGGPAREWAVLQSEDIDRAEEIMAEWLDERIIANVI